MQDTKSDLADASFQIRISRKTLATVARWFQERGHVITSKSELGRMSIEALQHIIVGHFNVKACTDSTQATRFLESIGLGSLSIRGREGAHQKQLQKEVAVEGGVLSFDPFERPKTVSEKLPQEEQRRIDGLVGQFEEDE